MSRVPPQTGDLQPSSYATTLTADVRSCGAISGASDPGSLFERDPQSNKVLWFSGPPIDIDQPEAPSHSAKYLTFLARRKLGDQAGSTTTTTMAKREDSSVGGEEKGLQEGGLWGKEKELEELLYGSV